jgi:16S rRNA processing protein RimM
MQPNVVVGRILGPVGLDGELRVEVTSDVPERFAPGSVFHIGDSTHRVQSARTTAKGLRIKLLGVTSHKAAMALSGQSVYVSEEEVPPQPEGIYYYYQVLGMRVVTSGGDELGVVTDILSTGANDVYVVKGDARETLVPALADVVLEVDVQGQRMVVDLPEGL